MLVGILLEMVWVPGTLLVEILALLRYKIAVVWKSRDHVTPHTKQFVRIKALRIIAGKEKDCIPKYTMRNRVEVFLKLKV